MASLIEAKGPKPPYQLSLDVGCSPKGDLTLSAAAPFEGNYQREPGSWRNECLLLEREVQASATAAVIHLGEY